MASSGRPQRVVHQDYLARIRHSNALPPPPNPPKLLDIPNTGLSGGLYTSAGFSSRLAREQPLNIEADAELGMTINLVGVPGVFDGNESAIFELEHNPVPHPSDRSLLRPVAALGKLSSAASGVSFLRRTEYISSSPSGLRFDSSTSKDLVKARPSQRRKRKLEKDDPLSILRGIIKGFDLAYPKDAIIANSAEGDSDKLLRGAIEPPTQEEQKAWANPVHPCRPDLRLLDAYPLLPDLAACPDTGSFVVTKFNNNPVPLSRKDPGAYDARLDLGLLRPLEDQASGEYAAKYEAALRARHTDSSAPAPTRMYDYEVFIPAPASTSTTNAVSSAEHVRTLKRKFDPLDNDLDDDRDDADAGAGGAKRNVRFERVRAYETSQQTGDADDWFCDAVAVALHDGERVPSPSDDEDSDIDGDEDSEGRRSKRRKTQGSGGREMQKAAYFYPITQRTFLRPRRDLNAMKNKSHGMGHMGMSQSQGAGGEDDIHVIEATVRDRTVEEEENWKGRTTGRFDVAVEG